MDKELKILFVEDLPFDVILVRREIGKNNIRFKDLTVEMEEDYIQALERFKPDVILSDFSLPRFDGMRALRIKETIAPEIPFILITGAISEETAVEVMKAGADDYIIKGNITRIGSAIEAAIEKKNSETQLQILSKAMEQNPASVIIVKIDGEIEFINPKYEAVTGYSREKLFKKNFRLLASSWTNPHIFDDIYNQLLSGKEWSGEIEKRRKSGDLVYENTTISPIFNENGRITHFLGISEDITEKKRVMQQLDEYRCHLEEMVEKRTSELERKTRELETKTIELEKAKNKAESADRLKSAFLANLSHELRTPLNSVIGFSSILLMGKTGDLNEEQRKQIKMIKTSGNHLLSLITDILDLSKIEAGQMNVSAELFDIQDTIEELHKIMLPQATGKGLSFIFERRPFSGVLKSDKQRVRQIIANLISNAIKFTNQGSVLVGCTRENNHLRIQVSDTGIGIKEDDFEKLFIPFIQIENDLIRKHPGSGLGLSISKKLAEMLNGSLGVESQFGSGSTFTLTLPVIVK